MSTDETPSDSETSNDFHFIPDALTGSLKKFYKSSKHCDMIIECGERKWDVHKLVLALHSRVFEKLCYGPFKGAKEGVIDLSAEEGDVVNVMIENLYGLETFNYDDMDEIEDDESASMTLCVRLFALADRFDMSKLKALTKNGFKGLAKNRWMSEEFVTAIREMYEEDFADDRSIRGVAMKVVREHKQYLVGKESVHGAFSTMAKEIPDFAADLIQSLARVDKVNPRFQKQLECGECSTSFSVTDFRDTEIFFCPSCESGLTEETAVKILRLRREELDRKTHGNAP
ncbi:hypothetical protein LTR66_002552 [Elasticomyces elasticus]|nr:hypothetical protein LTR28_005911 [Elasticomyces elasticus]KAK4998176.1 hypothetical protein LTR66_002552 [Elasticomyces elasticus]